MKELVGDDPDPKGMELARECMASVPEASYRAMMLALMGFDQRSTLKDISVPTLLLSGSKDNNAPAPMMAKTATFIPSADARYTSSCKAVKKALGNYTITPDIDGTEARTFNPVAAASPLSNDFPAEPQIKVNKHFDPFGARVQRKQYDGKWQELFEPFKRDEEETVSNTTLFPEEGPARIPVPESKVYECFQVNGQYLVAQTAAGMMVVDQQAAHQRILYEKFLDQFSRHQQATQQLLFPRTLELSPADFELVISLVDDLRMLGFDISEFGKNSVIINGTPPEAGKGEARELLEGLLEQYKLNMTRLKLDKHDNMARSMAYQAAVKRGTVLGRQEMVSLVEQLLQCHIPAVTPAGNPTFITFADTDLAAWFNR